MTVTYTLQYKVKISKKQARAKICAHAMWGNHGNSYRPNSVQETQNYFLRKGINTNELTEWCRVSGHYVPDFENLVRSTWVAVGSRVSVVDSDGKVVDEMTGPGLLVFSSYKQHFEAACEARDRAVTQDSYSAFQECLSQGFASIDAFLNMQAKLWNKQHAEDKLIDSKRKRVSLEDKIDQWVPKISGGSRIAKNGKVWNHFKILKRVRDEEAIHPKVPGRTVSYSRLAKQINLFRLGIAQLLGNLHSLMGVLVPAVIINAIYMPDVEVVVK